MEEYCFLAPMLRLSISSASLNICFWNPPRQSSRCTGQATKSIDRVTRLDLIAERAEKYFSAQSAGRNSTISGADSVRISSQGLFSSWSKLSPENIASSRLAAPGSPRMVSSENSWWSRKATEDREWSVLAFSNPKHRWIFQTSIHLQLLQKLENLPWFSSSTTAVNLTRDENK